MEKLFKTRVNVSTVHADKTNVRCGEVAVSGSRFDCISRNIPPKSVTQGIFYLGMCSREALTNTEFQFDVIHLHCRKNSQGFIHRSFRAD